MNQPPNSSGSELTVRLYRSALRLYPADYRRRFSAEMEQVFRAQWRAVRGRQAAAEMLGFVFWTAGDLLLTAVRERIAALRNPRTMKPASTSFAHLGWSLAGGLFVSAVILSLVTAVTLAVPKTYMSTTRVLLRSIQPPGTSDAVPVDSSALHTELATIESSLVLRKAAERVNLAARWTPIYLGTGHNQAGLQPAEIVAILKDHVEVRQVRNTPVAEIRVYNTDRQLAADLANAIAQSYLESRLEGPAADRWRPSLIDLAEPGLRPVRPNVPLNVFVGLLTGGALGAVTAGGLWWLLRRRSRSRAMAVAPTT